MTGFEGLHLPPPIDWQKFERLCRDLWAEMWEDPRAQLNGRNGQAQGGVDVYGIPKATGAQSGVQCKRRGNSTDPGEITEAELREEVRKARTFEPPLKGEFVLATTGARDAKIQEVARRISDEHRVQGLFSVHVYAWEDIESELGKRASVFSTHFGALIATVRELDRGPSFSQIPDAPFQAAPFSGGPSGRLFWSVSDVGTALEPEHQAQIDSVKSILRKGETQLALEQAEVLRARVWPAASPTVKARLLALLGHIKLDLADDVGAAPLLIQGLEHAPDDAAARANAALGHLLLGNRDAALTWAKRATDLAPTNMMATQVKVLLDDRADDEVVRVEEAVVGRRSELYAALGQRALRRQDFAAAERHLAYAAELAPDSAEAHALAGQSTIERVARRVGGNGVLTDAERESLTRAIEHLDRAWSGIVDKRAQCARVDWIVSRTIAKHLLGADDATQSGDEALTLAGNREDVLLIRASIASRVGDNKKVVELVSRLPSLSADARGLRATALANDGDLAGSIADWESMMQLDLAPDVRDQVEQNYVQALVLSGRVMDARATIDRWLSETPAELARALIAIETGLRIGDPALRDRYIEPGIALARAGSSPRLLLRLGDALMRTERPGDAAEVYTLAGAADSSLTYACRRVQAFYEAGRFESSLEACRAIAAREGAARFCAETESHIHEQLGDLARARGTCEAYLASQPSDASMLLRLATVFYRAGDEQAVQQVLARVDRRAATQSVSLAGTLAQLLVAVGRQRDALEVLFQTRRRNADDPRAHLLYIGRHAELAGEPDIPAAAGPDTAVELSGPGAPGWILSLDDPDANPDRGEYPQTHPTAKAIIGRRVGDAVTFEKNPAIAWKIAALDSKYGFSFRQSLETFSARFPAQSGFEVHETPEGDPEALRQQLKVRLEQGEPHRALVLRTYQGGLLTVGGVAAALNRSAVEGIGIVASSPSGLIGSTGSLEERANSAAILRDQELVLVADLTACVLLHALGVLRDGLLASRKIAVPQTTLDELIGEGLKWQTPRRDGFLSVGLHEGQLVRFEVTPEEIKAVWEGYRALAGWIRQNCAVLAVSPAVAERNAPRAKLGKLVGQSFWDALLVASEPGRVLLSDDMALRRLHGEAFGRPSVCSPLLLLAETSAGRLSAERHRECLTKLLATGYRHLSVDPGLLLDVARADKWRPQGVVSRAFAVLRGPETEVHSAVNVAAEFFRLTWFEVVLPQQREVLWISVLDALSLGRPPGSVMPLFLPAVRRQFALVPFAEAAVLRTLAAWQQLRVR